MGSQLMSSLRREDFVAAVCALDELCEARITAEINDLLPTASTHRLPYACPTPNPSTTCVLLH